jgi:DNA-binding transcriptional regulator GbsR (MarR family)
MWDNGFTHKEICKETGASKSSVSLTVKGLRNDPKVIGWLRKKGCPSMFIEMRKIEKTKITR